MISRRSFLATGGVAGIAGLASLPVLLPSKAAAQSPISTWDPTYWWWWNSWTDWTNYHDYQRLLELEVQVDPAPPSCCWLTDWPDDSDETNYTIYTQAILEANIGNYFAHGGTPTTFNTCKFLTSIGGFTLAQLRAYLRANPEILEEVAFIMDVAPEAVLIMGILLIIALLALAAYC
jgi:hypothetical protein